VPPARQRARLVVTAGIAALIVVAGTPAAADRGPSRTGLRAQHAALTARARSALYELYAQDAQLARARANERRQAARVARLDEQVQTQTGIVETARANLGAARDDLRERILERYKSDRLDPVEVLLGSTSLEDALHRADTLQQVQSDDRDLVERTLAARDELAGQLRSLQAAEDLAVSEHAALSQRVHDLAAQRDAKRRLLAELRQERAALGARIVHLDALARAAVARAAELARARAEAAQTDVSDVTAPDAGPSPVPQPGARTPSAGQTLTVSATAYGLPGHTASGLPTGPGICATDPSVIPLGTRFYVPGYGPCVAADTGSAIIGDRIDVWLPYGQALAWGRQTVTITFR
jgi:3D (Asp-Asp-Asp) domain-containing protein